MLALFAPILAMNFLSYIPWTIIFLWTQQYGIRFYYLQKRDECSRIQKRLQGGCSHTTDGGKGYGYSLGYWYMASINITSSDCGDTYTVYLLATDSSYKALTGDIMETIGCSESSLLEPGKLVKKITVHERTGSYANPWFRRRERDANDTPSKEQKKIITEILAHQKCNRHTVVYLHGPPCTGKSMIGVLVANEFGGSFCNTLQPWQPGDNLGILHSEVEPTQAKPLVMVFDEVDAAILRIHEGIPAHSKIPIVVADKPGWNRMFDEIQRGMYPDIIVILTSNRGPDFIDTLDHSYIRKKRMDMIFEMKEVIE